MRESVGAEFRHDGKFRIAFQSALGDKWWRLTWRGFVLGHYSSFASACKFAAAYGKAV